MPIFRCCPIPTLPWLFMACHRLAGPLTYITLKAYLVCQENPPDICPALRSRLCCTPVQEVIFLSTFQTHPEIGGHKFVMLSSLMLAGRDDDIFHSVLFSVSGSGVYCRFGEHILPKKNHAIFPSVWICNSINISAPLLGLHWVVLLFVFFFLCFVFPWSLLSSEFESIFCTSLSGLRLLICSGNRESVSGLYVFQ